MSITFILLTIACLVLLAGLFAAAAAAAQSARRELSQRAKTEPSGRGGLDQQAAELAANPLRCVPSLQLGRTLMMTVAAAVGGALLTSPLSDWLAAGPIAWIAEHHVAVAVALIVLGLTGVNLFFGEFIPKQIARTNPDAIFHRLVRPIALWQKLARPLLWPLEVLSNLVVRCLGFRVPKPAAMSIEDIEHLIRACGHEGLLDPAEQMLSRRALRLGDRTVRDIMHPRIEIDALDVDTPPDEVIGAVAMAGFSRLPIHEGDLDHIIGFVYTKDLLLRQHMGWPIELRKLVRPALLVPESLSIGKLLERFRTKRTQMAIVLDEFGGTEGLVTMEDVLEELVGEIHDEHRGERQHAIIARDDSSWYVDAAMPLHELLERLNMLDLRDSLPAEVSTVAGLVLSLLGRIPSTGESAAWAGLTIEVTAMEGRRLDRVLITRG